MPLRIACIVEGHGDVAAVPVLLRRICAAIVPFAQLVVDPTIRVPRSKLVKQGEVERSVELAARRMSARGAVLILIDSNGDCPAQLGPLLLDRAKKQRSNLPIGVVLAKREFEAWFLAAAPSLRGKRGLPADLESPADPEAIQGVKEWLTSRMPHDRSYGETLDQAALAAQFDLEAARQSDSFDKCYREVARLLTELQQTTEPPLDET